MTRQTDAHVQQFQADNVRFARVPFNSYQYRYYMRINGIDIRISKDVYRQAKESIEEQ